MIDIGNIDLTYEDGLRLSELLGQRAELAYSLDHILMHCFSTIIAIAIVFVLLGIAVRVLFAPSPSDVIKDMGSKVYKGEEGYDTFRPSHKWLYKAEVVHDEEWTDLYNPATRSVQTYEYKYARYTPNGISVALAIAMPQLVFCALAIIMFVAWSEYDLSKQLVGVDAQIEELLSRYGVV